jgi:hypothetical protein
MAHRRLHLQPEGGGGPPPQNQNTSQPSIPPVQNTNSNINLQPRQGGPSLSVFVPNATNTLRIGPSQIPDISNLSITSQNQYLQQPRHVRALANTHSTSPSELGRKTTSSIIRNKLTPAEKAKRINEQAIQYMKYMTENTDTKQNQSTDSSAPTSHTSLCVGIPDVSMSAEEMRKRIEQLEQDRKKREENYMNRAMSEREAKEQKRLERISAGVKIQFSNPAVIEKISEANVGDKNPMSRARLLSKLPQGAREIAIEHNLNRNQIKSQLEAINSIEQNPPQGPPTTQDDPDIIDY